MKKIIQLIFILNVMSTLGNSLNSYEFIPIKVADGMQVSLISKLDSLNLVVSGGQILSPLPDFISNTSIFKSSDAGLSWKIIYNDTNQFKSKESRFHYRVDKIEYLTENRIILFYSNGFIRRSENSGLTWVLDSLGTNRSMFDVKFIDENIGFIVWDISLPDLKQEKILQKTTNGGKDWIDIDIPITSLFGDDVFVNLYNLNFVNDSTLFINSGVLTFKNDSIYDSEIFQIITKNLGETWEKKLLLRELNRNGRDVRTFETIKSNFQFISFEIGFWMGATPSQTKVDLGGNPWEYPFLKKTTDSGKTWQILFHDTDSVNRLTTAYEIIDFFDVDNLILKGNPSGLLVYNKNESYFRKILPENYSTLNKETGYKSMSSFIKLDNDRLIVTGNSEYIYYIYFKNPITFVQNIESQSEIEIFPNPMNSNQSINIKFSPVAIGVARISIIDINSSTISSFDWNLTSISETLELKPNINMTSGLYFVQIEYQNGIIDRQKFIVN